MKERLKKILSIKYVLGNILFNKADNEVKQKIKDDYSRYLELNYIGREYSSKNIRILLYEDSVFRTLFVYRMREGCKIPPSMLKKIFHTVETVELVSTPGVIGGGLFIGHTAEVVLARKIGEHWTIGAYSVIGGGQPNAEGEVLPVLGNNVCVHANASIFGGIHIGDNVTIGAGAVVNKDVPDNCVVVGNPARIVRQNGVRVDIPL